MQSFFFLPQMNLRPARLYEACFKTVLWGILVHVQVLDCSLPVMVTLCLLASDWFGNPGPSQSSHSIP